MARREASPDFAGALARGLDVIRAFQPRQPVMSLTAVAAAAGLARPAARRVLLSPDIVYVARVAMPKIIALAVTSGSRFPAMPTSPGKVLLAALTAGAAEEVLAGPGRSGITARWQPGPAERAAELREARARGWARSRTSSSRRGSARWPRRCGTATGG